MTALRAKHRPPCSKVRTSRAVTRVGDHAYLATWPAPDAVPAGTPHTGHAPRPRSTHDTCTATMCASGYVPYRRQCHSNAVAFLHLMAVLLRSRPAGLRGRSGARRPSQASNHAARVCHRPLAQRSDKGSCGTLQVVRVERMCRAADAVRNHADHGTHACCGSHQRRVDVRQPRQPREVWKHSRELVVGFLQQAHGSCMHTDDQAGASSTRTVRRGAWSTRVDGMRPALCRARFWVVDAREVCTGLLLAPWHAAKECTQGSVGVGAVPHQRTEPPGWQTAERSSVGAAARSSAPAAAHAPLLRRPHAAAAGTAPSRPVPEARMHTLC